MRLQEGRLPGTSREAAPRPLATPIVNGCPAHRDLRLTRPKHRILHRHRSADARGPSTAPVIPSTSCGARLRVTECERDVRAYSQANRLAEPKTPLTRPENASTDVTRAVCSCSESGAPSSPAPIPASKTPPCSPPLALRRCGARRTSVAEGAARPHGSMSRSRRARAAPKRAPQTRMVATDVSTAGSARPVPGAASD